MAHKDILSLIDPDINILSSSVSSSSILSSSASTSLASSSSLLSSSYQSPLLLPSTLKSNIHPDSFNSSILHLNIRSLFNKMSQFSTFLSELNFSFSLIGLTETWLDDCSSSLISLPNYNFVFSNRQNKIGGGVGLFIKNSFNFILRQDLCPLNLHFDWLAIEIFSKNSPNIIVFVVYRPPNTDPSVFTDYLAVTMNHKSLKNKYIYILGDFNINLLNNDVNNISHNFSTFMSSINLIPLITHPTRISTHSSTLIDNIYTNNLQSHQSAVLLYDLSDHFPICTFFKSGIKSISKRNQVKYSFSKSNLLALNNFLSVFDWTIVLDSIDVNYATEKFLDILHDGLDKHCLSNGRQCRHRKQSWITPGLLKSSTVKNKLYKKYLQYPSEINKITYTRYKNRFNSICKLAKSEYINRQFFFNKFNIKNTWNLIKQNLNNFKANTSNITLKLNDKILSDKVSIANTFNNHFSSADLSISQPDSRDYKSFLTRSFSNSFFMLDSDPSEINSIVKNLSNSSSSGDDEVSSKLLKNIIHSCIIPLTHVINLSLSTNCFPSIFKLSKTIPIFKKGDKTDCNNY